MTSSDWRVCGSCRISKPGRLFALEATCADCDRLERLEALRSLSGEEHDEQLVILEAEYLANLASES